MAFGRLVDLRIGTDPRSNSAIKVSELDVAFEVERSIYFGKGGSAEITIFNAGESTRQMCCRKGAGVELRVGYEDSRNRPGVIFSGNIISGMSSHSAGDWITKIKASSGRPVGKVLEATVLSVSYSAGTPAADVLADVAALLGFALTGVRMTGVNMPNGYTDAVVSSVMIENLRKILAANGYGLYADNNELVVYAAGEIGDLVISHLTPDTGLLKVSKVEDATERTKAINAKRKKNKVDAESTMGLVEFTSLIYPELQPNKVVRLTAPDFTGTTLVESIKYKGDNMGKEWIAECKALYR